MAVEIRSSAFQTAQRRFDAAADVIGLSEDARQGLREVKRELTVHFPVRMDDGSVHVFTDRRKTSQEDDMGLLKARAARSLRINSALPVFKGLHRETDNGPVFGDERLAALENIVDQQLNHFMDSVYKEARYLVRHNFWRSPARKRDNWTPL